MTILEFFRSLFSRAVMLPVNSALAAGLSGIEYPQGVLSLRVLFAIS
jgi:hypothetical protein